MGWCPDPCIIQGSIVILSINIFILLCFINHCSIGLYIFWLDSFFYTCIIVFFVNLEILALLALLVNLPIWLLYFITIELSLVSWDMYDKYRDLSLCYFLPYILTSYVLISYFPVIFFLCILDQTAISLVSAHELEKRLILVSLIDGWITYLMVISSAFYTAFPKPDSMKVRLSLVLKGIAQNIFWMVLWRLIHL